MRTTHANAEVLQVLHTSDIELTNEFESLAMEAKHEHAKSDPWPIEIASRKWRYR